MNTAREILIGLGYVAAVILAVTALVWACTLYVIYGMDREMRKLKGKTDKKK